MYTSDRQTNRQTDFDSKTVHMHLQSHSKNWLLSLQKVDDEILNQLSHLNLYATDASKQSTTKEKTSTNSKTCRTWNMHVQRCSYPEGTVCCPARSTITIKQINSKSGSSYF